MKPEILKIRLGELENFTKSEVFRSWKTIPVSRLRVQSYLHNPDAQPDDLVLYLALTGNNPVAFRTLFAGSVFTTEGIVRFGWCSGNWVHPDFRRKGFSEMLFNEAYSDWEGRLMFTNYAPNSEKLYLKTGRFRAIHQFQGFRGYLFAKTRKLAPLAKKNKITTTFLTGIDWALSAWAEFRTWVFTPKVTSGISFAELIQPDQECFDWLEKREPAEVFPRGTKELQWIFGFPWISAQKTPETKRYPFSSFSESFSYHTIKVYNNSRFAGFFIFSVREGNLKTLCFYQNPGLEKAVAGFFKLFCVKHKIEVLTVYNYEISRFLFEGKFPFLRAKNYGQKIYSSFNIVIPQQLHFQDGDGDVIFT